MTSRRTTEENYNIKQHPRCRRKCSLDNACGSLLTMMHIQMQRPPSTSRLTPVINLASELAMNTQADVTSSTSPILPIGTLKINFWRFSGVSSIPVNEENRPVPVTNGQMLLTRIWCGPYSAASPLVALSSISCEASL